jgi:hypothetical protein
MGKRSILLSAVWALCFVEAACTQKKTTQLNPTENSSTNSKAVESFDPRIVVDWPGKPEADVSSVGIGRIYYAQFREIKEAGGRLYVLSVNELSDEVKEVPSPRERLEASATATKPDETKRTPLEFGPRKLPGLEIECKSGKEGRMVFQRILLFVDGRRVYNVSVSGRDVESLRKDKATAFFDSARLPEK